MAVVKQGSIVLSEMRFSAMELAEIRNALVVYRNQVTRMPLTPEEKSHPATRAGWLADLSNLTRRFDSEHGALGQATGRPG